MDLLVSPSLAPLQASSTQVYDPFLLFQRNFILRLHDMVGSTLLLIATDAFQAYKRETGATLDPDTGLLTVPDQSSLRSLFFKIGDVSALLFFDLIPSTSDLSCQIQHLMSIFVGALQRTFEFTANAQIWPRSFNSQIGGVAGRTYLIVSDLGQPSGQGLDFINGFVFLYVNNS